jgi:hypothetical protein
LIALANLEPDSETRKHLISIARAFRAKRHGEKRLSAFVQIDSVFTIKVHLAGRLSTAHDDLALALKEFEDSETRIDLVRECPICSDIFWAGRSDKEACDRHATRWRKQEQRRREKIKTEQRAKARVRRATSKRRIERPLSRTSMLILEAIANQLHRFKTIDDHVYMKMHTSRWVRKTDPLYRTATVIRCLKLLADAGYIDRTEMEDIEETEPEHKRFYYTLRNKARVLFERVK